MASSVLLYASGRMKQISQSFEKAVIKEHTAPLVFDAQLVLLPLIERLKSLGIRLSDANPHETPWLLLSWPRPDGTSLHGAIQATLRAKSGDLCIRFLSQEATPRECEQRVRLITTRASLGGLSWWFVCPGTGARCIVLYLPLGTDRFMSATGHKLEPASMRGLERQANLARQFAKMGVHYIHGEAHIPERPAGMDALRYNAIVAKIQRLMAEVCGPAGFMNMRPGRGRPRKAPII